MSLNGEQLIKNRLICQTSNFRIKNKKEIKP